MPSELSPADAVREAPTELDRIIAEMREASGDFALWGCEIIEGFADRLAALAGAAPVACVAPEMVAQLEAQIEALRKADAARDDRLRFLAHAPAKAREDWQPMETAPMDGVILLAVEAGSDRKTFVAEASHEDGGMVWCVTSGWTGWTNLHRGWTPVGWRKLPERAALATFAEGKE